MARRLHTIPPEWRQSIVGAGVGGRLGSALSAGLVACLTTDRFAVRRMAVVQVLADGRAYPAREIQQRVVALLGRRRCWGRSPAQALWADLRLLRQGGLRIGYSRRPGAQGYFLYDPPLVATQAARPDRPSLEQIAVWRTWDSVRKLEAMFSAWEFALDLARAGARNRHPDWTPEQIEAEARRLVGGVEPPDTNASRQTVRL